MKKDWLPIWRLQMSHCLKFTHIVSFFNIGIFRQFWSSNDMSGNTVLPKVLGFQILAKLTIFRILSKLLSTINVARLARLSRLARNVE